MNIIDHGKWVPYKPTTLPEDAPANAAFSRRESDGVDWYDYIYRDEVSQPTGQTAGGLPVYPKGPHKRRVLTQAYNANSVKCAAMFQPSFNTYIVGAAVYDVTMLFPVNQYAFEVIDYTGSDPQTDFGNKAYDPIAKTISEPVLVVHSIPRSKVVERIAAAGKFQQLRQFLNTHPLKSEMWYGTMEVEHNNALILEILTAIGADPAVILAPTYRPFG